MDIPVRRPTADTAADIATAFCGASPSYVRRFETGIGHWVYDVRGARDEALVVRIGASDQQDDFAGAVYWSGRLRPLGVPLPGLLASGEWAGLPYLVLERLPGRDLGAVYDALALAQKRAIAAEIWRIQDAVSALGHGPGYGYVRLPSGPHRRSWREVIDASLARSRSRIERAGLLDARLIEPVSRAAQRLDAYFSRVAPQPFLDDTTTKNVIVHDGALSGIVDVDWICYGDPLLVVALTRTSLLSSGRDLDYVEHWCEQLGLTAEQQRALRFYTALFCADFLGELGHGFNREPASVDLAGVEHLKRLIDENLRQA